MWSRWKKDEGRSLGLLYTALSRATTLGDENGLNSAIYFQGKDFKPERIFNLYCSKSTGNEYMLAKQRRIWVEHLEKNTVKNKQTKESVQHIVHWAKTATYSYDALYSRILTYSLSKNIHETNNIYHTVYDENIA